MCKQVSNMISFRKLRAVWVLLVCLLICKPTDMFAVEGPTRHLEPVIEAIIAVLRDENLAGDDKREARRAALMCRVRNGFDFREMSKRILGRTWRKINEEDRACFTEQMTILLENTYIGKFEEYSGETVEYVAERVDGNKAQVDTIINTGRIRIPVNYKMILNGDSQWMVYDMTTEGVSLVRNYREQFRSILRKDKFASLLKLLEEKNTSFATR